MLVARVRAHLARYERLTGGQQRAKPELQVGGLRLNTETRRVFVDGREVELKNKEYALLHFLMLHLDMVFSREELYEKIWGVEAMGDNATVAVHINRIREKIEQDPGHPGISRRSGARGIASGDSNGKEGRGRCGCCLRLDRHFSQV